MYFLVLIFSLTQQGEMGWYMIPMFPFMSLLMAKLLVDSFQNKQNWFVFIMLLFVGLNQVSLVYEANFGLTNVQFRIIMIVMFAPFVLLYMLRRKKAFNTLSVLWFYLLILGNIFLTYNYIHPA